MSRKVNDFLPDMLPSKSIKTAHSKKFRQTKFKNPIFVIIICLKTKFFLFYKGLKLWLVYKTK